MYYCSQASSAKNACKSNWNDWRLRQSFTNFQQNVEDENTKKIPKKVFLVSWWSWKFLFSYFQFPASQAPKKSRNLFFTQNFSQVSLFMLFFQLWVRFNWRKKDLCNPDDESGDLRRLQNFYNANKNFRRKNSRINSSAFHDRLMHIARITHYFESIFTEPINYSILFICSGKEGNLIKRNNKMWFIGEISCWARMWYFYQSLSIQ